MDLLLPRRKLRVEEVEILRPGAETVLQLTGTMETFGDFPGLRKTLTLAGGRGTHPVPLQPVLADRSALADMDKCGWYAGEGKPHIACAATARPRIVKGRDSIWCVTARGLRIYNFVGIL